MLINDYFCLPLRLAVPVYCNPSVVVEIQSLSLVSNTAGQALSKLCLGGKWRFGYNYKPGRGSSFVI
jgi:hypothetical protein